MSATMTPSRGDGKIAPAAASPAPNCTLVIFGAHGDLTKRLLIPSLYNLAGAKLLDDDFKLFAVDRVAGDDDDFRSELRATMEEFTRNPDGEFYTPSIDAATWDWLASRTSYMQGDFTREEDIRAIGERISGNAIFYCAVAARFFSVIGEQLGRAGLLRQTEGTFRRIVVEKPFGADLASSQTLNAALLAQAEESQIYRIDHFLGKETVQNVLAFRFSNGICEPIWRREHIDHIQITAAETVGVEERGAFYEPTGALRDMVPNHLFTLMAMVGTEPPNSFDAESVRSMKQAFFESLRPVDPCDAVRGQYTAGRVDGRDIPAYRDSPGVAKDSRTETYVAMKLVSENWRWAGVPIYLRTGKCMTARRTEIVVHFRQAPYAMFRDTPVDRLTPNNLTISVQPRQAITLGVSAKVPGPRMDLSGVAMRFTYEDSFENAPNVGYETLLYDCLAGDATLFQRADNIDAAWAAVDPVLRAWAADPAGPEPYAAGRDGPQGAHDLLARDGRVWTPLD